MNNVTRNIVAVGQRVCVAHIINLGVQNRKETSKKLDDTPTIAKLDIIKCMIPTSFFFKGSS